MKIFSILLLFFSINIIGVCFGQRTLLLFTKTPDLMKIFDNKSELSKTPIWNKEKGGYLFELVNDETTLIEAKDNVTFKLSSQKTITKNIDLNKGSNISIYKCLNNERYCCESLNEKQEYATKKIYSMAVMKRSALQKKMLYFNNLNNSFLVNDNAEISWTTDSLITNASITDVNTMNIIWEVKKWENKSINLAEINKEKGLLPQHKYILTLSVKNSSNGVNGTEEFNYEFEINNFAFETTESYFPTKSGVEISWNTIEKIKSVALINNVTKEILWKADGYDKSKFSLDALQTDPAYSKIVPETEYILSIKTDGQDAEYSYSFYVILSDEESLLMEQLKVE